MSNESEKDSGVGSRYELLSVKLIAGGIMLLDALASLLLRVL